MGSDTPKSGFLKSKFVLPFFYTSSLMNAIQQKTQQDHALHCSYVFQLHLKSVGLRSFSTFELLDTYTMNGTKSGAEYSVLE